MAKLLRIRSITLLPDVAGDRLDVHAREFPREELAELVRDIVSGGNEAAEDDRTAVHVQKITEDLDQAGELAILLRPGKHPGAGAKGSQAAPIILDADPLGLIDRPGRRVIGQLFIAEEIENLGSIGIVDLGGILPPSSACPGPSLPARFPSTIAAASGLDRSDRRIAIAAQWRTRC